MELSLIVKEIRKHLSLTQDQFAECFGLTRSNLSQIEIGRNTPSVELLNRIANNFHIDIGVVFEMVNSEEKLLPELLPKLLLSTKSDKKNVQVDVQANVQVEKKCTPECTPKCTPVDQKGELALSREVPINVAHPVERGGIPLIPIEAAAGALSGPLQAMDFECEYYVIPSFKNAEFMIRITGDSMIPKYQAGDIVACQRLSLGTFFQWNNVYVVDSEQGALIKRVKRGSDKEHILLVSENQDYEPFELPLSEVNGLGQVVGIVRLE